jgi:tripartite ATP-independent transporter DctP family solute receptor
MDGTKPQNKKKSNCKIHHDERKRRRAASSPPGMGRRTVLRCGEGPNAIGAAARQDEEREMAIGVSRRWVLAAGSAIATWPTIGRSQDKITLKMGTLGSTEYFYYKGAVKMAEEVAQKTNGQVNIQVFPNQQLGNERDMIEGMQLGTIDLAVINTPLLASFDSRFQIFDMPFMFNDWPHVEKVLTSPIGQTMLNALESKNLKGLAFSTAGHRHVLNYLRPVKTPDDLKGLKIRVLDNPVHVAIMNAMGANATPMQYSEVATALRQHTVDGLDSPTAAVVSEKFYETQKYMSLTGHVFTGVVYLMALKRFQALGPDVQKAILEAGKIGADLETEQHNRAEVDGIGLLRTQHGMVIDTVDKGPFRARMQPVFDRFQDRVGKDLIESVRKMGA